MTKHAEYWREAAQMAMESLGKFDVLTSAEYDSIGDALSTSAENQSMAFGWDCIPNPVNQEISELKKRHAEELARRDRAENGLKAIVARAFKIEAREITANSDGRVFHSSGRTTELVP